MTAETNVPRCPLGCGLAKHKGSCAAAKETLDLCARMLAGQATEAELEHRPEPQSSKEELRSCPFCGGVAETDNQRGYRRIEDGLIGYAVAVYCTGPCNADMTLCLADVPNLTAEEALAVLIENWNKRSAETSGRHCTCHPDDNPPRPCPKKYALNECRRAAGETTPRISLPDLLFDGYAVMDGMTEQAKRRTSWENVSDVLDALVKLLRAEKARDDLSAQSAADGWLGIPGTPEKTNADLEPPCNCNAGCDEDGCCVTCGADVPEAHKPLTGVDFLHAWMRADNPMLGGITPLDMLKMGRGEKLAYFIEEAYEAEGGAEKLAYHETHEPPHCPSCLCGERMTGQLSAWPSGTQNTRADVTTDSTADVKEYQGPWVCECGQTNSDWANKCGRCERQHPPRGCEHKWVWRSTNPLDVKECMYCGTRQRATLSEDERR